MHDHSIPPAWFPTSIGGVEPHHRNRVVEIAIYTCCVMHSPAIVNILDLAERRKSISHAAINFAEKLALFDEQWAPKVIAEMNDYQFKIAKIEGNFVWHRHEHTDETFIVLDGNLRIDFRDGAVKLSEGEMYVVPRGIEHKPYAANEVEILLIEPRGVLNTGDDVGERTAENDVWI